MNGQDDAGLFGLAFVILFMGVAAGALASLDLPAQKPRRFDWVRTKWEDFVLEWRIRTFAL